VPVYKLGLVMEGEFTRPALAELGIQPGAVDWKRAHLAVGISDARTIQESAALSWGDQRVGFLPGTGGFTEGGAGIHAPVEMTDAVRQVKFSFPLALNGSLRTDVVPFGRTTVVEMQGDDGHPSFQGNWLPSDRTVSSDAFKARWSISFLGRSYPQAWTSDMEMGKAIDASRFGVELIDPVDHYRMAERSVKYAGLFILLTFATVWLIEILAGVRVHSIQYLMLGGALCLFYLLELSLSEHLGFPLAYVAASVAVVGMVGGYGVVALRSRSRALVVAGGVSLLYAYLYLLLMNEDYALLIGSVGLFAILGAIMFATRRVDWYSAGARPNESPVT
jgi:inner membrane protein